MGKFAIDKVFEGQQIIEFYKDDFNYEKLKLHHDMFIDIVSREANVQLNCLTDVIEFINSNNKVSNISEIFLEYIKYIQLIITITVSSCRAERSFSSLMLIKSYLISTMTQTKLNSAALLNV